MRKSDLSGRKVCVRIVLLAVILSLSLLMAEFILSRLVVALGESTPYRLFFKKTFDEGDIKLHSYVLVRTPETDRFAKGNYIVKQITCLPGNFIKIIDLDYYCCKSNVTGFENCVHLGRAKTRSRNNEPVIPFNPCNQTVCTVQVPEKHLFLTNQHKDSYDSRYLGMIPFDRIESTLIPLF